MIGFFNCNKPQGVSSAFVVNKIKKTLGEKCGHLGTLDPNATGVLPIAVGKATRFFDYFLKKDKVYIATCKFGELTTTLDPEGEIVKKEDVDVTFDDIETKISTLKGKIMQVPPLYSAKSINGKRAYEYAKQNAQIELEPREVEIFDFVCIEKLEKNVYKFKIHCSAGTYVRSLLLDLAKLLGTVSTTLSIDRQKSGPFEIVNSNSIEQICGNPQMHLLTIEEVLKGIDIVNVDSKSLKMIADGKMVKMSGLPEKEFLVKCGNKVVCLAHNVGGSIKSKIYLYMEEE